MTPKDFAYDFPPELIARYPSQKRDDARLLVLNRRTGERAHKRFSDICSYFKKGDVIVLNNSKVFPCRLAARRPGGARQELLLLYKIERPKTWRVLINNSRKVKAGEQFKFDGLTVTILDGTGNERRARLEYSRNLLAILERIAEVPLPPYLKRRAEAIDTDRYQTVYAEKYGSVAAPTAGLHFTHELLERLSAKGVILTYVTLHVGPGTFTPVRTPRIKDHSMHTEYFSIPEETAQVINRAKRDRRPITAVGTTTTRALESAAKKQLTGLKPVSDSTALFIYPPFKFKIVDRLITNFHLPQSTLLMLVSAFAERELVLKAYQEAVDKKYRLFSYGDAMMIV